LNGSVGGIIAGLRNCEARAEDADVILSTAHKSKGAQWGSVKLSEEFQNIWEAAKVMDKDTKQESCILPDGEDLALQYVAATRAEELLVHRGLLPKAKEHLLAVWANQINKRATA
jgi:superfamily I DNA/RNA helicase